MCMTHKVSTIATPGWETPANPNPDQQIQHATVDGDGDMSGAVYDVYIVTDGVATFTLTFDGVPAGQTTIEAEGVIDATVEQLGPDCDHPASCEQFGHGHATHEVSHPGIVVLTAVAYHLGPGYRTLGMCMDPQFGAGTPDAGDTTLGCPTLPTEGEPDEGHLVTLASPGVGPVGSLQMRGLYNNFPDGEVRVGYTAGAYGTEADGHSAFGVWLTGGIENAG